MKNHVLPLMAAILLLPAAAEAKCNLSLSAANITISWSQNFTFQTSTFTLSKSQGGACKWGVTMTAGGSNDFSDRRMVQGATPLAYQLYKDPALTRVIKDGSAVTSSDHYISGNFGGGNDQATITYYVQIPQSSASEPGYKPGGTYSDTYTIKAFDITSSTNYNSAPDAVTTVSISTAIPKIVEIDLSPSSGTFNPNNRTGLVDFGTITPGESQTLSFKVRSNAGYEITLSSQNNGSLRHASPSVNSTVPYQVTVNSVRKDLGSSATSPVAVVTGSGQTTPDGVTNQIVFTAGSTSSSLEGQYQDYITLTASTIE